MDKQKLLSLLRLNIRDFLWMAVVLGLALGWWTDHSRLSLIVTELNEEFAKRMYAPPVRYPLLKKDVATKQSGE